jgi:hypothetical protein
LCPGVGISGLASKNALKKEEQKSQKKEIFHRCND